MVPNGFKCSHERFGGRYRRLFITEQEISPRQLNRQKKIFFEKIPKPRGHTFIKNLSFPNSVKNGAKRLQMLPGKVWRSKQKAFITGQDISARQLKRQKRFF
ncbi:Hypothetical predicted protein [Podarcis lilfordi]|uniref:Uncharacterized protein n=1 Tax=Podarcis lilfordi TaxID=74358 RepID=A0AA35K4Y6_9SAUR|nr:Hypothetical predicted protein [Podarcis lilfordi]